MGRGGHTTYYYYMGYYSLRPTSGQYASYWNAFLFMQNFQQESQTSGCKYIDTGLNSNSSEKLVLEQM